MISSLTSTGTINLEKKKKTHDCLVLQNLIGKEILWFYDRESTAANDIVCIFCCYCYSRCWIYDNSLVNIMVFIETVTLFDLSMG